MKINLILILALFLYACNNSGLETTEFNNSVCLEFVEQSGYPIEICDCVKNRVSTMERLTQINYEDIELLVNECVQGNLGIGY